MYIEKKEYEYSGPVKSFDKCIDQYWTATTWAESKKKARSNLTYRYKRDHDMIPSTNITLPGKLIDITKGE